MIDYTTTPFESAVKEVDVVLDTVGGADAASASPSRRGELGGGVSDDCRRIGEVF